MWTALLYVNYLSYFQQWNLDSDITFPNSFIDSKSEFFEFDIWPYFQVFPNSQRNFGIFLMLFYLDFSSFPNSWKSFYEYNSNLHFYGKACVFFPINQVQMREKFQNFPGITTSPNPPTVFGTNWTSLLTPSFAGFLSNMQYFPIIGQCRFFKFWNRPWYLMNVLGDWIIFLIWVAWVLLNFIFRKNRLSFWSLTEKASLISFHGGIWSRYSEIISLK